MTNYVKLIDENFKKYDKRIRRIEITVIYCFLLLLALLIIPN